jgi:hypothetical protein
MNQSRTIGMMINHHEIEHTLTQMADVIRNAAYKVATARYPVGHPQHLEFFDETGTLTAYDELSIKGLLKDALEHYLQFNAGMQNPKAIEFSYYLNDSFKLIQDHINENPQTLSYLSALFAMACGNLAGMLSPVIEDLSRAGQSIEKVESYTLNTNESYYLVFGESPENAESYDPKEDDLKGMIINDSPEVLARWEMRKKELREQETNQAWGVYSQALNKAMVEEIANPTFESRYRNMAPRVTFNGIKDTVTTLAEAPVVMLPAIFPEHGLI